MWLLVTALAVLISIASMVISIASLTMATATKRLTEERTFNGWQRFVWRVMRLPT